MKTLRLLRNVAALFILAMTLLALRPGVGVAHAAGGKSCGYFKEGHECYIDASGQCQEFSCGRDKFLCLNQGCF